MTEKRWENLRITGTSGVRLNAGEDAAATVVRIVNRLKLTGNEWKVICFHNGFTEMRVELQLAIETDKSPQEINDMLASLNQNKK